MAARKRRPRGSGLYHPLMVRVDAETFDRLTWLAERWGKQRGTLARHILVDMLGELVLPNTPLGRAYAARKTTKPGHAGPRVAGERATALQARLRASCQAPIADPVAIVEISPPYAP